jgi:hypothetical protein
MDYEPTEPQLETVADLVERYNVIIERAHSMHVPGYSETRSLLLTTQQGSVVLIEPDGTLLVPKVVTL